jgi:DNA-binding cell septation regulator SpoVG
MERGIKRGNLFFLLSFVIIALLILNPVSAVKVVQEGTGEQPQQKEGFMSILGSVFSSPIFWGAIVIIILVVVFGFAVYFIVKFIIQFIKMQDDSFYRVRKERIKLASAQRRMGIKSGWFGWGYNKNPPIRLAQRVKDSDGKIVLRTSQPVAYYSGDFVSHEGNHYISFNMKGNHYVFGLIPKTELLVIPTKDKIEIKSLDIKGNIKTTTMDNLPTAKDIVQFNDNEIILHAEGISSSNNGMFYYPVVKTQDGKMIDLSMPIYHNINNVAVEEVLYNQTDSYSKAMKKMPDINPYIRAINKTGDGNQSLEIPSSSGSGQGNP